LKVFRAEKTEETEDQSRDNKKGTKYKKTEL